MKHKLFAKTALFLLILTICLLFAPSGSAAGTTGGGRDYPYYNDSFKVPADITRIEEEAFYGCESMSNIVIPATVSIIGDAAFHGCDSLCDVYYHGTQEQWNELSIGTDNTALQAAVIHFVGGTDKLGNLTWMEITIPSTYSIYLNGMLLGEEHIVADDIHYDIYEDFYYDLSNLPTKVTYRFDNVIGEVQVDICDEDGNHVTIDPNKGDVQFIKPVDKETLARLMALMEPFTEKYLVFRSGATDRDRALANLKPYIIPGSDIDKCAQNALDALSWAHSNSFKLTDYKFNGVLPLMNGYYVCSVTATTDTYTYGKGEVTDIMELRVIVYDDGETTLAFQVK
mgnify:CR=1 FL=1